MNHEELKVIYGVLNEAKEKPKSKAQLKAQADELLKNSTEESGGSAEDASRDRIQAAKIQTAINAHKKRNAEENSDSEGDAKVEIGPNAKDAKSIKSGGDDEITGQEEYKKSLERLAAHTKRHLDTMSGNTEEEHEANLKKAKSLASADVAKENEAISSKIRIKNRDAALLKLRPTPEKFYTAKTVLADVKTPTQKVNAAAEKELTKLSTKKNVSKLVKTKLATKKRELSGEQGAELGGAIAHKHSEIVQNVKDEKKPKNYESKHIEALHGREGYQTPIPNPDVNTNWESHKMVQGEPGSAGHNLKQFIHKAIAQSHERKAEQADYEQAKKELTTKPTQSSSLQRSIERVKKGKNNE